MFRLFIWPAIFGLMVALALYFITPFIYTRPDFTAIFASFVLRMGNAYFTSLPPVIAAYIADLNLAIASATVGVLVMLAGQLLMICWGLLAEIGKRLLPLLRRSPKKAPPPDLTPIDIDPSIIDSKRIKKVLGRGFDTVDRL